jgi:hypothetical protein
MFYSRPSSVGMFLRTIILGAIAVAIVLAMLDPKQILTSKELRVSAIAIDYQRLLAIEPMQNDRARLGYVNGVCETNDLREVLQAIKRDGKGEWFFGIPFNGTKLKGEYINLVYVDHFERILCSEGVFYRARLNVQGNQCCFVEGLINCGTEFFTARTYRNMVNALEALGVGDAEYFKPRRTLRLEACECN